MLTLGQFRKLTADMAGGAAMEIGPEGSRLVVSQAWASGERTAQDLYITQIGPDRKIAYPKVDNNAIVADLDVTRTSADEVRPVMSDAAGAEIDQEALSPLFEAGKHYRDRIAKLEAALKAHASLRCFFSSVIKSGEEFSPQCQETAEKAAALYEEAMKP